MPSLEVHSRILYWKTWLTNDCLRVSAVLRDSREEKLTWSNRGSVTTRVKCDGGFYSESIYLSAENRLRFRIRRGNFEVELEGESGYVKEKFEELMAQQPSYSGPMQEETRTESTVMATLGGEDLEGILETGPDGKPHFTIPFDSLTAKEAIGLVLYKAQPNPLGDKDLSDLLNASWKTTKPHVIRARASELRKDGRLITEKGRYSLSGAGLQWVRAEVIPSLRGVRSVQS